MPAPAKKIAQILLLLYVVALHCSIAGMEILSWTLALLVFTMNWRQGAEILRRNRTLLIGLGAFIAAVVLSLLTNPLLKPFTFQLGFMRWVFVLFALTFTLQAVWSLEFEKNLIRVWLFACTIVGLYAAFQSLTGIDFVHPGKVYPEGHGLYKAVGFFIMSLTFAYMIGMSTILISFPAWKFNRKAASAGQVGGVLGLIAAFSRGAWVSFPLAWLTYFAVKKRRWLIPAALVTVAVFGAMALFSHAFQDKFMSVLHPDGDPSLWERRHIWAAYWQLFKEHPLFGVGLLQGDKLLPGMYAQLGIQETFTSHAHNNFMQFLVGSGVFGLCAYLFVCGLMLVKTWRLRELTVWGWPLLLSQIFFHLGGLTQADFIDAIVNHMLMFHWAMVLFFEWKLSQKPT